MESVSNNPIEATGRPKRLRHDVARDLFGAKSDDKKYELNDVVNILKRYDDYEGGINCPSCGKLYKSKVCFIKHLWEHSIYWEMFSGQKNHERVLCIQAAIILMVLYNRSHGNSHSNHDDDESPSNDPYSDLASVLVTSPHKKDKEVGANANDDAYQVLPHVQMGSDSQATPSKTPRHRSAAGSEAEKPPCTPVKTNRTANRPPAKKRRNCSVQISQLDNAEEAGVQVTTPRKRSKVMPPLTPVKNSRLVVNCPQNVKGLATEPTPALTKQKITKKNSTRGPLFTTESENVAPANFSLSTSVSDMGSPTKFTRQC